MKRRTIIIDIIILLIIFLIAIGIVGIISKNFFTNDNTIKVVKDNIEKYVAYIKISPSIKLEYSHACTLYSDGSEKCTEPKVYNYELINDDAKEIFKNVNILENNSNLSDVIELICKKAEEYDSSFQHIEIQSDWNKIKDYLKENSKDNQSNNDYSVSVNIKEEDIRNTIESDIKAEKDIIKTIE